MEGDKINELIIQYPKVKTKLPLWNSFIKLKRYKRYYNIGLKTLIKKGFKPDLVHCNIMNPVGLVAKLWKRKHNIPYIITEHWTGYLPSDGRFSKDKILKLTLPKIAKWASLIMPVSSDLEKALSNLKLGSNFQIIRNVVNTDKFTPLDSTKDRFLVVADLENSQKNISGLITAFNDFIKSNHNIKLSLAGGGEDEFEIKNLIKSLNLKDKIKLHGRVSAEELNVLLSKSHASILFSNYENLPCVIVESFAAGVPFISTNVGGVKEIINEERGFLIAPNDKTALVRALNQTLLTNWQKEALRNYAVNNFSYQKIGQELNSVYQKVIGNK